MERNEFLSKLGLGLTAVCVGCSLVSCGSGSEYDNPKPTVPSGSSLFSLDLSTDLLNVGDSKVIDGVIIARIALGNTPNSFAAVQVACTHLQAKIAYNVSQNVFICPWHKSMFSTTGQVLRGPAVKPQQEHTVTINNSTLNVLA